MKHDLTTTLFRPVGQAELDLVAASGWKRFPPRLSHQPIFYPVTNQEYAEQIAREWNANEAAAGYVGYVTKFSIASECAAKYPVKIVGASRHAELWVPAEELESFNDHIVGTIEVVVEFRRPSKRT